MNEDEAERITPTFIDWRDFSGIPTALVDLGCCGASTDDVDVVQLRAGKIVPADFWWPNGTEREIFGQGASGDHGIDVMFNASWNAVVSTSFEGFENKGVITKCQQDTFVWNPKRKRFEWNRKLSYKRHAPNCGSVSY